MNDILIFLFYGAIALSAFLSGRDPSIPLGCFFAFIALALLREQRERARQDFITQLRSFRPELRSGGTVAVDHLLMRYDTALTTYDLSVGFLVGSVHIPSPFRIYTGDVHYEPIIYSLVSLITGWWALPPAGPLATLALVQRNLVGGYQISVAQLIDAKLFNQSDDINSIFAPPEKKAIKATPVAVTGERSASGRQIRKRTEQPAAPSLHERMLDLDSPVPLGVKLRDRAQKRLEARQDELRARFKKTKETIKSKRLRKHQPNKSDKSGR